MTVALVRHGRTAWNQERRLQGRTDLPLDDLGRSQADVAGRILARGTWDAILTSPLMRARQTAEIISGLIGVHGIVVDAALTERDFGEAEGMPVGEASAQWITEEFPGAEPWDALTSRASAALSAALGAQEMTVLVAHGTFLRAGVQALTGAGCPRILNGQVIMLDATPSGGAVARIVEN